MLTRSKTGRVEATENSGDAGVPNADALDRGPIPAFLEASAAPNPAENHQNFQTPMCVIQSTVSKSPSRSSQSSATVRALRATAEAKLARQQLERKLQQENERRERELQLENERRRIEELELAAELASLDAGHSRNSVSSASRTEAWVAEQVPEEPSRAQHFNNQSVPKEPPRARHYDDQFLSDPPRAHCDNRCVIYPKGNLDLTAFNGGSLEWLIFQKNYNSTKHLFSNLENLNRLSRALHGRARESVSMLLLTSETPDEVMQLLEQTFARPEAIVTRAVAEVRMLPKLSLDLKDINNFCCKIKNCISVVKLLNQPEYLYSPELFNSVLNKLTPLLRSKWLDFAYTNFSSEKPKLMLLSEFLSLETDKYNKFGISDHSFLQNSCLRRDNVNTVSMKQSVNITAAKEVCVYCSETHNLKDCSDFIKLSPEQRWSWLYENKFCYRCIKGGSHRWKTCKAKRCGIDGCLRFHHPLLHGYQPSPSKSFVIPVTQPSLPDTQNTAETSYVAKATISNTTDFITTETMQKVYLRVIPVTVSGPKASVMTYALLDEGSTATLIDSELATSIGAVGPSRLLCLEGVSGMSASTEVQLVDFEIKGRFENTTHEIRNAKTVDSLSLLSQTIRLQDLKKFTHLTDLSEILCSDSATPKILLGAEHWHLTIPREIRMGSKSQPVAARCLLGWSLHGQSNSWTRPLEFVNHALVDNFDNEQTALDTIINDYFKLDSLGITKHETKINTQDKRALEILDRTSKRLPSGRFEVGLLWRENIISVPDSYQQALSRFLSLERRMQKDDQFASGYKMFMQGMLDKGYAEECTDSYHLRKQCPSTQNNKLYWYLPHFGVVHPQKKKLRVVHDAAAKTLGVSLNSMLLAGPDLLQPLLGILFRFREGCVALNADIKEMFPQIRIRDQDRDALRFLWRDDPNAPIRELRMTSVIFGAACSPCTALYVKNKNALEFNNKFPEAVEKIVKDHYMDDYIGSVDSEEEASKIAADIVAIHKAGGFEMRGWVSNRPSVLSSISEDLRSAPQLTDVGLGPEPFIRTLGMTWHPQSDVFGFRLATLKIEPPLTKRKVLSYLMQVYDPLGFLLPYTVEGRILFQSTWKLGLDWDADLPTALAADWVLWISKLAKTNNTKIQRWYGDRSDTPVERELHVFCDASELAYACVVYWRYVYADGHVKLSLVGGKARVAPVKPVTVPRLELQGALIAARFAKTLCEAHRNSPTRLIFWTDSTTVLSWLRNDSRLFKPFVMHRVAEITESTEVSCWKYVPGNLNPADAATRPGNCLDQWLAGPPFLLLDPGEWPLEPPQTTSKSLEELKVNFKNVNEFVGATLHSVPSPITADPTSHNTWLRLVRSTAMVFLACEKFRSLLANNSSPNSKLLRGSRSAPVHHPPSLSASHLIKAEETLLQRSQVESFEEEIACLLSSKPIPKYSKLFRLTVIYHDDLLKLDGRIEEVQNADQISNRPIILDGRNRITRLLIHSFHLKAAHANNETVINQLREQFWILSCRGVVREISRNCQSCKNRRAKTETPRLGDLPSIRLAHHSRAFSFVGLDYFGPLDVTIGRRREKRYGALYTCLTSRAIHLEIVASLTSDSAILSLRRFISRRGCPIKIVSDNGTCFVGANRELKVFFGEKVEEYAANNKIIWEFIPPASPFMGGCWERLVRSVKTALRVTLKQRAPSEETLQTVFAEAEALINCRPLVHVPVDPEDPIALTPFHFLLGTPSTQQLPSTLSFSDRELFGRAHWKKAIRLADHFWTRWVKEYLPTLVPRRQTNMAQVHQQLQIDDVVLIVDENLPRGLWPIGKITSRHPGKDGTVRVVEVKTKAGTFKRPTRKVVKLPIAIHS